MFGGGTVEDGGRAHPVASHHKGAVAGDDEETRVGVDEEGLDRRRVVAQIGAPVEIEPSEAVIGRGV
jgi:hypothetical protein